MEAIGRLAGGVAHDFNNLLTVVLGRCELLRDRAAPGSAVARDVDIIRSTATRAAELTRQLLAFSRTQILQPKVLDLNRLVADMQALLRPLLPESIALTLDPGPDLWRVCVDAVQIQQVMMNLLINARDAMPEGGRIRLITTNAELDAEFVRAHRGARAGAYVALSVVDPGSGMDATTKARAFEPFFTTKAPGEGTGLGLSTVYGIVKQSEGYITLDSTPGAGTTVTVYLPRTEAPLAIEDAEGGREPRRATATVLLVEDEPNIRAFVGDFLRSTGHVVIEAPDAATTLSMAERLQGPLDLLLTDIRMPGMNGVELARQLLTARPTLKVIFMSGSVDPPTFQGAMRLPGSRFLAKPFTTEALRSTIGIALRPPASGVARGLDDPSRSSN
jgi:CheY-like chemotaxis protein